MQEDSLKEILEQARQLKAKREAQTNQPPADAASKSAAWVSPKTVSASHIQEMTFPTYQKAEEPVPPAETMPPAEIVSSTEVVPPAEPEQTTPVAGTILPDAQAGVEEGLTRPGERLGVVPLAQAQEDDAPAGKKSPWLMIGISLVVCLILLFVGMVAASFGQNETQNPTNPNLPAGATTSASTTSSLLTTQQTTTASQTQTTATTLAGTTATTTTASPTTNVTTTTKPVSTTTTTKPTTRPTTTTKATTTLSTTKATTTTKKPTTTSTNASGQTGRQVQVVYQGKKQTINEEEAVAIWMSNEMPSYYSLEALKAQAVTCRTYIRYQNASGTAPNIGTSDKNVNATVQKAVAAVAGKVMYSGGKVAYTPWHAMSIGVTLASEQVWSGKVACLRGADSALEIGTKTDAWSPYAKTYTFTKAQMQQKLNTYITSKKLGITLSSNPANWVKVQNYHKTVTYGGKTIGYVKNCALDGKATFSGRVFRETIMSGAGLRSSAFTISYDAASQQFSVTTYGYGHGCGMSQTGAKLYAQSGWKYDKILTHYYTGVTIAN